MFLAILIFAGGFFLKWKGHFSFWGSALQVFGQCGGAKCGLGFAKTIFWGKGFGKTSADFVFAFVRAGVWGGMRASFGFAKFFLRQINSKSCYEISSFVASPVIISPCLILRRSE